MLPSQTPPKKPAEKMPAESKPVEPKAPAFKPVSQTPPSQTISSYRKKQQMAPFVIWGGVVLFIVMGIILLIVWFLSGNGPKITLFATETPTPTLTFTPTATNTPTETPTVTPTATNTLVPTPDKPFEYVVQEGDTLYGIVSKEEYGLDPAIALPLVFYLNPTIDQANPVLSVGQKIWIPNPGMPLPTSTPIPFDKLSRGAKVEYYVQPGDSLEAISAEFNSTVDAILALQENKDSGLTDANKLYVGQLIIIPVNMVTPTITPNPTITPGATITPEVTPTSTPAG